MLWEAYVSSKKMKVMPSEAYFIDAEADPLAAWCFNRVVLGFGAEVEADLERIGSNNSKSSAKALETKRQRRLEKWLGLAPRFKDPAAR